MQSIYDFLKIAEQALNQCADCLEASIEAQLIGALRLSECEGADFDALRRSTSATAIDHEIGLLRLIEQVITTDGRNSSPLWLTEWLDNWPQLTGEEIAKHQGDLADLMDVLAEGDDGSRFKSSQNQGGPQ